MADLSNKAYFCLRSARRTLAYHTPLFIKLRVSGCGCVAVHGKSGNNYFGQIFISQLFPNITVKHLDLVLISDAKPVLAQIIAEEGLNKLD